MQSLDALLRTSLSKQMIWFTYHPSVKRSTKYLSISEGPAHLFVNCIPSTGCGQWKHGLRRAQMLAILLAAMVHDLGHDGLTNSFHMVRVEQNLAFYPLASLCQGLSAAVPSAHTTAMTGLIRLEMSL